MLGKHTNDGQCMFYCLLNSRIVPQGHEAAIVKGMVAANKPNDISKVLKEAYSN